MKFVKLSLYLIIYISFFSVNAAENNAFTKALQLNGNVENGKKVYKLCASCHLENGWGKANGSFPVLAGQHKTVIIKQLKDIQNRNRKNPTMFPFSDPTTIGGEQNISDVVSYIASLSINPNPGVGSGKNIKIGKKIYSTKCSVCHGEQGEGSANANFPKISNQHYLYLLRQLDWMQKGLRKNTNSVMLSNISTLSAEELAAVSDYISRL